MGSVWSTRGSTRGLTAKNEPIPACFLSFFALSIKLGRCAGIPLLPLLIVSQHSFLFLGYYVTVFNEEVDKYEDTGK
jgi:hypothetical protein